MQQFNLPFHYSSPFIDLLINFFFLPYFNFTSILGTYRYYAPFINYQLVQTNFKTTVLSIRVGKLSVRMTMFREMNRIIKRKKCMEKNKIK